MAVSPVESAVITVGGESAMNAFHQLRLRHLSVIGGVNLNPGAENGRIGSDYMDEGTYYLSLHLPSDDEESKPEWKSSPKAGPVPIWSLKESDFDDNLLATDVIWELNLDVLENRRRKDPHSGGRGELDVEADREGIIVVVIRIWIVVNPLETSGRIVSTQLIHFRGLVPVRGMEPSSRVVDQAPREKLLQNSLVFAFGGVCFVVPTALVKPCQRVLKWAVKPCSSSFECSYDSASVCRLRGVERALQQAKEERRVLNEELEKLEASLTQKRELERELSLATSRLDVLRRAKEFHSRALAVKKEKRAVLEEKKFETGWMLMSWFQDLTRDRERMRELGAPALAEAKENLDSTKMKLLLRRRRLLSQLSSIYPICRDSLGRWMVAGVRLPDSENYAGHDDTQLAVAFGNVVHLCMLISFIVNVPLKYPVKFQGSRSWISNHVCIPMSGGKELSFQLFDRKSTKQRFDYAAYLMNLNVAHLRSWCSLSTSDLRLTLLNLSSLINDVTPRRLLTAPIPLEFRAPTPPKPIPQDGPNDALRHAVYAHSLGRSKVPWVGSHPNMPAMVAAATAAVVVAGGRRVLQAPLGPTHSRSASLGERHCLALGGGGCLGVECGLEATEDGARAENCDPVL
ncbi:unnamed protein product [Notodromas monacha]|uniref:UV radiation resistance-associated gene protein n=1 Tax=Notodromas monacha TaxID=399045 RepID=A0A7R9BR86_9CRUS|nr:unnamed protein product [Notodromas monacha]CAG0918844.1 unnamed protein product [Notodromas monacha]